ncbi:methyl-accepting chemotaxis protein [Maritalea sp.]|uniref:methyl-accepting chemotaxis protein n=1 Tax=Maritalea sp. TaxID=2003361 RepID=UPI003EF68615
MMNSYSLSRFGIAISLVLISTIAFGAFAFFDAPGWLLLAAGCLCVFGLIYAGMQFYALRNFVRELRDVSRQLVRGDFDFRLHMPKASGECAEVRDSFNDLVDVSDAFVRESYLAMQAASEGRYYRKIRPEGLLGAYQHATQGVNAGIDKMAAFDAMLSELRSSIGFVVERGIEGDLNHRVDANFADDGLNELAEMINRLMITIDLGISETGRVLADLAEANLTTRVDGDFHGAFGKLRDDTNDVAERLSSIMFGLRNTSGSLKSATGEILSGSDDLAQRTMHQAATLEHTSAAMSEMAETVQESSEQARAGREQAISTKAMVEESGQAMQCANVAMERISESSQHISKVIEMIDGIAFQTNLLALNASVEAARAGEAGKGFAVVAVEVRRLAQSTAQASKEVKDLIQKSAGEVEQGSELVAKAGEQLETIVDAVGSLSHMMSEIADVSRTQSEKIEVLNSSVRQMDETTQHNAALVEETNAAIEQTESRASELDKLVGSFQLGNEEDEHVQIDVENGMVPDRLAKAS